MLWLFKRWLLLCNGVTVSCIIEVIQQENCLLQKQAVFDKLHLLHKSQKFPY